MNIIVQNGTKYIYPSEGYLLAFRGDSSNKFFSSIVYDEAASTDHIVEVKQDNVPVYVPEIDEDIFSSNEDEIQQYLIQKSKILLKKFLEENPMEFQGKLYNVSFEAQQNLNSIIEAAEYAKNLNIPYMPTWNDIQGIREPYDLETLKILFIQIQQYVANLIIQQQQMELDILSISDKQILLNYNLAYIRKD